MSLLNTKKISFWSQRYYIVLQLKKMCHGQLKGTYNHGFIWKVLLGCYLSIFGSMLDSYEVLITHLLWRDQMYICDKMLIIKECTSFVIIHLLLCSMGSQTSHELFVIGENPIPIIWVPFNDFFLKENKYVLLKMWRNNVSMSTITYQKTKTT